MIQIQTLVRISDNSGGKIAKCIKILKKGAQSRYGNLGDIILVSIQELRKKNRLLSKVKKGEIVRGIIVKVNQRITRKWGLSFAFNVNSIVIIDKQGKPLASRVLGIIPKEIKKKNIKIISLSSGII